MPCGWRGVPHLPFVFGLGSLLAMLLAAVVTRATPSPGHRWLSLGGDRVHQLGATDWAPRWPSGALARLACWGLAGSGVPRASPAPHPAAEVVHRHGP